MNAVDLIRRLHQHRAWVNRNLLITADSLTDDQMRKVFSMGQGSVWKTFVHLHAAEFVWLGALLGDEDPLLPGDVRGKIPGNQEGSDGRIAGIRDLHERWTALEQRWSDYLETLGTETLDDIVYKKTATAGRFGTRRSDILLHVCTHAQYTTAQVVNMFRQLGIEKFPDTMLISLARQESVSG